MTLEEFLNKSNKFTVECLPTGSVSSLAELYEKLIKNSLPKVETIIQWNNLLLIYVNQEDSIFFIRRYASASNKQWHLIRRGFLTEYSSGLRYVFCDNYFAHYFYLMALNDFIPEIEEFSAFIKNRKFPYGYMKTSQEEPFQAYPKGKAVNINSSGWKLAHLYSVNQNDYNFNYKEQSKYLFPIGSQEDWIQHNGNNFPSRYIDQKNTEELRKITIAHFLRLVHPINYFLVPSTKLSNIDIGESPEVIKFMKKIVLGRSGNMLNDYEALIMANSLKISEDYSYQFQLHYGKINISTTQKKEIKEESLDKVIRQELRKRNNNIVLTDIKASEKLPIEIIPNTVEEFKQKFIETGRATLCFHYDDGRIEEKIWENKNFTENSDLMGNLRSRPEARKGKWKTEHIVKLVCKI